MTTLADQLSALGLAGLDCSSTIEERVILDGERFDPGGTLARLRKDLEFYDGQLDRLRPSTSHRGVRVLRYGSGMTAKRPENDIEQLATQIAAVASAPGGQQQQLRGQLAVVAESAAVLGEALVAPADDQATRTRIADEIDRLRTEMVAAVAQAHVRDVPLTALAGTLEVVASWLRAPTPENTAAVERLVAAIRAVPGGDALWTDQVAEAKRKAELDADVQKSLDEIKAGMPKFKL